MLAKITVIVRHLIQRFANPNEARALLQAQQSSAEALEIKRHAVRLLIFVVT
uniref:Uncharacterized protein n=1 Tax=Serratia marcescens TaxID=615 RepID=A0A1C3H981_SERMA|nr:Uncharacterised protein [Serratia marcescens]